VSGLAAPAQVRDQPLVRWNYVTEQWDDIQARLVDHVQLTLISVALGLVIAAGLAALALRFRWTAAPINGLTAFIYTIPSVALFGVLTPYFGISKTPAIIALTGYTLLILVSSIVGGFRSVPRAVREAANGMGLTPRRRLFTVELPLALPFIITGIRVATVTTIGLVTVASVIGQGGLGDLILDGLQRAFWTPMIVGAVLSVLLALAFDLAIYLAGRAVTPWARRGRLA
jgi:osmoprotectant transport system permease protein